MDIHTALQLHSEQHIQSFLKTSKGEGIDVRDIEDQTPLHIAASQGLTDVVKRLLKKKANINAQDSKGWTPLHFAANEQHYPLCLVLIQHKADVTLVTKDKATVLTYVCKGRKDPPKQVEVLKALYTRAPKLLDQSNYRNETPLSRACIGGSFESIQFLITHKADVNSQTSGGITCLHNAARSGRIDVIKLLLENNADHTIKNSEQFTPLEEVIEFGDKDLAASLLSLISPQHSDGYIPRTNVVAELVNVFNKRTSLKESEKSVIASIKKSKEANQENIVKTVQPIPPVKIQVENEPATITKEEVEPKPKVTKESKRTSFKNLLKSDTETTPSGELRPKTESGSVREEAGQLLALLEVANISDLQNYTEIKEQMDKLREVLKSKSSKHKRRSSTLRSIKGRLSSRSGTPNPTPAVSPGQSKLKPVQTAPVESCSEDNNNTHTNGTSKPPTKVPPKPPPRRKLLPTDDDMDAPVIILTKEEEEEFVPKEIIKSAPKRKKTIYSTIGKLIDDTADIITPTGSEDSRCTEHDYLSELEIPPIREMSLENTRQLPKEIQARQLPFQEIICTETQYIRQIGLLIAHYLRPLQNELEGIISTMDIKTIFCNIEDIFKVSKKLLQALQEEEKKEPEMQNIGSLFISFKRDFGVYPPYCTSQSTAIETLERLRQDNKQFDEFLIRTKNHVKEFSEDISGYLIKPFQRICRYVLLLKELLKQTPKNWKDHSEIENSLGEIGSVVKQANETQRVMDNLIKIEQIQSKLDVQLDFKTAVKFITEGDIKEAGQRRHFFLFSSLLAVTKPGRNGKYINKYTIPIKNCIVWNVPDNDGRKNAFQIVRTDSTDKYVFECKSQVDKETFMNAVNEAISPSGMYIHSFEK